MMVPEISLMGCRTISGAVDGFSLVATEAETLNGALTETTELLTALSCFKEKEETLGPDLKKGVVNGGVGL